MLLLIKMKPILTKQQIQNNPNFACDISAEVQTQLREGNAQLITDICQDLHLRDVACAVAALHCHLFFLSKSYLEYDRTMICCASILIASKAMYEKVRINDLVVQYWQYKH